jgi:hypothetical protein
MRIERKLSGTAGSPADKEPASRRPWTAPRARRMATSAAESATGTLFDTSELQS